MSVPGQAKSQADDTLSLCFQAQAALVLLGLTSSRAFAKTLALVHSIASTTLPLVFEGNTFYNLKKYILQFEEIHFTIWKEIRG